MNVSKINDKAFKNFAEIHFAIWKELAHRETVDIEICIPYAGILSQETEMDVSIL